MSNYKTYEKLHNFMASYVPEFSYQDNSEEPGSVLTTLCGDMIEESAKRYDDVIHKHKVQYLNLFENLRTEPVSASKGYVQFQPIAGYEGDIMVPAKTQVTADDSEVGEMVFETCHDLSVTIATPQLVVNTDKEKDTVVRTQAERGELPEFCAFSLEGENEAAHKLYLGFDSLFEQQTELDCMLFLTTHNKEEMQNALELFTSSQVTWYVSGEAGNETFDVVEVKEDAIHLVKYDYVPQKTTVGQREAYYVVLDAGHFCPEVYIETIALSMKKQEVVPTAIFVNNVYEPANRIHPFGLPLGIYNEFSIEDPEVLSKRGAHISVEFQLDYTRHEETFEVAEMDLEYKSIMKKPQKAAGIRPSEVAAEYVVWEYYSTSGWKRLLKEERACTMFNGTLKGETKVEFDCPLDMAPYEEGQTEGRIRVRLMRADNIYKVPAIYSCPVIWGLQLSYSYEENKQNADYAFTQNCYDIVDVTNSLQSEDSILLFYKTEHEGRCMYLGFDYSVAGMPASIYFDLDNYSDVAVDFQVEYSTAQGFKRAKAEDATGGMLSSGNMLFLIPKDMEEVTLYGMEGYFLRFVNYNKNIEEYALPKVKGIYMNMAKVVNENKVTEYFYLDSLEDSVDITLSNHNLLQLQVWVSEVENQEKKWVLWENQDGFSAKARTYQADMADGTLHFYKMALCSANLDEEGPQIRVEHYNYTGSKANLEKDRILTLKNSIRYISAVTNPFPTYGGYDGYTERSAAALTNGLLRTRNRAVTAQDYADIIAQKSFGVHKVKCKNDMDIFGNAKPDIITVAVLIDEYEKGIHIFSEMKEEIRKKLLECSDILPKGKTLLLSQPHFVKLNVRIWMEKENMEQAYDLQNKTENLLQEFIDPLKGGSDGLGWDIGDFPRASQITAYLRTHIWDCNITNIIMTAQIDGKEVDVKNDFYDKTRNPFIMAINGNHIVYIDIKES